MPNVDGPIPLSEIESVLSWVDSFKLSRTTKKIHRDFSDAVLLAEILSVHYPKLVEMHNYPPRNSHSLKLNNWMTLNKKVLKRLKLTLCCNTMEQLANSAPGVIERVLVMVKDKIRRDEDINKSLKESEQNISSGGSYYEACGDDENVLVIPVKTRVNGVLETIQQKVVIHESYIALKEEMKDSREATDVLKQKVEHLENMLKLKEERIDELQKQLERKQSRRKEVEAIQNSLAVPFETVASPLPIALPMETSHSLTLVSQKVKVLSSKNEREESKIPIRVDPSPQPTNLEEKPSDSTIEDLDRIKSDVFQEVEIIDMSPIVSVKDFYDTENNVTTIEDIIQKEIIDISNPIGAVEEVN